MAVQVAAVLLLILIAIFVYHYWFTFVAFERDITSANPSRRLRTIKYWSLENRDPRSFPALIKLAGREADESVLSAIFEALGGHPGPDATAVLLTNSWRVRNPTVGVLARALAQQGDSAIRPLLESVTNNVKLVPDPVAIAVFRLLPSAETANALTELAKRTDVSLIPSIRLALIDQQTYAIAPTIALFQTVTNTVLLDLVEQVLIKLDCPTEFIAPLLVSRNPEVCKRAVTALTALNYRPEDTMDLAIFRYAMGDEAAVRSVGANGIKYLEYRQLTKEKQNSITSPSLQPPATLSDYQTRNYKAAIPFSAEVAGLFPQSKETVALLATNRHVAFNKIAAEYKSSFWKFKHVYIDALGKLGGEDSTNHLWIEINFWYGNRDGSPEAYWRNSNGPGDAIRSALALCSTPSQSTGSVLKALLEDKNPALRCVAAAAMAAPDYPSPEDVIRLLADPESRVSAEAAETLAVREVMDAYPALRLHLKQTPANAYVTCRALARLNRADYSSVAKPDSAWITTVSKNPAKDNPVRIWRTVEDYGTEQMAMAFMNSDSRFLAALANTWAARHGYYWQSR